MYDFYMGKVREKLRRAGVVSRKGIKPEKENYEF